MIFGRIPAQEKDITSTNQDRTIYMEQVDEKVENQRFDVDYIKAYDGLSL